MTIGATAVAPCWSGHGLTITIAKSDPRYALLQLAGELDRASAPLLRAALENQLAIGRRYIRLNLAGLDFLDASARSVLVEMHREFLGRRGTMILTGASSMIRTLLRIDGLDKELFIGARQAAITWPAASATQDARR